MALLSQLGKYKNTGLFIIRVGLGVMMVMHGLPKIAHPDRWAGIGGAMKTFHITFFPAFWGFMCAVTEAIGGLFSVLGLWFRVVSLFMFIVMVVAATHHIVSGDGIMEASHAIELAFAYLGLMFLGPGLYSVDRK